MSFELSLGKRVKFQNMKISEGRVIPKEGAFCLNIGVEPGLSTLTTFIQQLSV